MSLWMKKLHWKKVFIAGLWYVLISTVLHQAEAFMDMRYYTDPAYFGVWSKLMMPVAGPPPAGFFIVSLLFSLATGCTLAAVYEFMSPLFGKGFWQKVIGYTDIMVGLSIVFGYFPMYLLFNVPVVLLAWWLGFSWVTILGTAMVFEKVYSAKR